MEKLIRKIRSLVKTLFFFNLGCCLVPVALISYSFIYIKNKFLIKCLSLKYPHYEISKSKKVRTLIDTSRNAGIFHFLLEMKGHCDFNTIKENYMNHLVERRNKSGAICFPKLRRKLISCWGHYAWKKDDSDFDVNNHIVVSPRMYRGRPVSESNIQEFVTDLVAKYIPSELPPWHITVIPAVSASSAASSESEQNENEIFYVLVRIHHLLIAEEENLHVSDMLLLRSDNGLAVYDSFENPRLSDFIEKPKHIPNLWNDITMTVINRWNEFIYKYDPLESPDVDKKQQITCISQFASIFFITVVTVIIDFIKGYEKTNNQLRYKLRFLVNLYRREAYKRNLNIHSLTESTIQSLNPINIIRNFIKLFWMVTVTIILLSPYYIARELFALKDVLFTGQTILTNTYIGLLSKYIPLLYHAYLEIFKIIVEIVKTPRNIFEELLARQSKESNVLQVKSYSGRKVVAFSKSIDLNEVRERVHLDETGETEFIFACLAGSLHSYLENFKDFRVPSLLNATCRSIFKDYFLERSNKTKFIGGVVFIQLPLRSPSKDHIEQIRKIIERVREKQIAIYLISLAQTNFELITSIIPEFWMKILINYFSIAFPVTITDIHGNSSEMTTLWGQTVSDLLFFRPPQSKTCLSLNIHRFGNKTRLAVMADTQLAPDHGLISSFWENNMETVIF